MWNQIGQFINKTMGNICTPLRQQPAALPPLVTPPDPVVLTVDSSSSEGSPNPKKQKRNDKKQPAKPRDYGGSEPPEGLEGVYYTLWSNEAGEITDQQYMEMTDALLEAWGIEHPDTVLDWAEGSDLDWVTWRWVTMELLKTAHDEVMLASLSEKMMDAEQFTGCPTNPGPYVHQNYKYGWMSAHIQVLVYGKCKTLSELRSYQGKPYYDSYCVKMVDLLCGAHHTPYHHPFIPEEVLSYSAYSWWDTNKNKKSWPGPWSPGFVDEQPFKSSDWTNEDVKSLVAGIMYPYALVCDRMIPGYHSKVWNNSKNLWQGTGTNQRLLEEEKDRAKINKNYERRIHSWTNKRERKEKSKMEKEKMEALLKEME